MADIYYIWLDSLKREFFAVHSDFVFTYFTVFYPVNTVNLEPVYVLKVKISLSGDSDFTNFTIK